MLTILPLNFPSKFIVKCENEKNLQKVWLVVLASAYISTESKKLPSVTATENPCPYVVFEKVLSLQHQPYRLRRGSKCSNFNNYLANGYSIVELERILNL